MYYYTLSSIYMAFSLYLPVWVLLRLAPTNRPIHHCHHWLLTLPQATTDCL